MQLKMQVLRKPYPRLCFDCLDDSDTASHDGIVIDESYILCSMLFAEPVHEIIKERQEEICKQLRSDIAYGHTNEIRGKEQALAPVKIFPKFEIASSLAIILRPMEDSDAQQIQQHIHIATLVVLANERFKQPPQYPDIYAHEEGDDVVFTYIGLG